MDALHAQAAPPNSVGVDGSILKSPGLKCALKFGNGVAGFDWDFSEGH
jgi:hypothetical protein